jgi:hypothetical protein
MQLSQFDVHLSEYLQNRRSFFSGNMARLILLIASSSVKALTAKLKDDVLSFSTGREIVTS